MTMAATISTPTPKAAEKINQAGGFTSTPPFRHARHAPAPCTQGKRCACAPFNQAAMRDQGARSACGGSARPADQALPSSRILHASLTEACSRRRRNTSRAALWRGTSLAIYRVHRLRIPMGDRDNALHNCRSAIGFVAARTCHKYGRRAYSHTARHRRGGADLSIRHRQTWHAVGRRAFRTPADQSSGKREHRQHVDAAHRDPRDEAPELLVFQGVNPQYGAPAAINAVPGPGGESKQRSERAFLSTSRLSRSTSPGHARYEGISERFNKNREVSTRGLRYSLARQVPARAGAPGRARSARRLDARGFAPRRGGGARARRGFRAARYRRELHREPAAFAAPAVFARRPRRHRRARGPGCEAHLTRNDPDDARRQPRAHSQRERLQGGHHQLHAQSQASFPLRRGRGHRAEPGRGAGACREDAGGDGRRARRSAAGLHQRAGRRRAPALATSPASRALLRRAHVGRQLRHRFVHVHQRAVHAFDRFVPARTRGLLRHGLCRLAQLLR